MLLAVVQKWMISWRGNLIVLLKIPNVNHKIPCQLLSIYVKETLCMSTTINDGGYLLQYWFYNGKIGYNLYAHQ